MGHVVAKLVGEVKVITMDRPERRNAMNTSMLEGLLAELRASARLSQPVVINGADHTFSAGADVAEEVDDAGAVRRMRLFADLYEEVTAFPAVTVAAVDGHCVGGGAEVAAACDLRVGTHRASIRFPGAQFGIPVGSARLVRLLGLSHAKDLLMTTRTIDGPEAFRMGFLNRLVEPEEAESVAVVLAEHIASNPGALHQKRILDEMTGLTQAVLAENRSLMRWQSRSAEA